MIDLTDLIQQLSEAEGGSRELDFAVLAALDLYVLERRGNDKKAWWYPRQGKTERRLSNEIYGYGPGFVPRFTESLDAALTLVPEGWIWKVCACHVSDDAWVVPDFNDPVHGPALREKYGEVVFGSALDEGIDVILSPGSGNPARALCIAALRARQISEKDTPK